MECIILEHDKKFDIVFDQLQKEENIKQKIFLMKFCALMERNINMHKNYKRMEHNEFLKNIDKLCDHLRKYIQDNKIKIDYICPILRSGAVPATYISNKLNIIKFLPIQVKHIAYKNGENKIEMIFNPFDSIEIKMSQYFYWLKQCIVQEQV